MEAEGLSLEKEEDGEQSLSEGEQDYSVKQVILLKFDPKNHFRLFLLQLTVFVVVQDGWSSFKEVTLRAMSSDEQYDPDTVYGTSLFLLLTSSLVVLF